MRGRLVTSEHYRELIGLLEGEIREERKGGGHGPIYVLAGSNLAAFHCRTRLVDAMGGLLNLRFMTFPDLLEEIEARSGVTREDVLPPGTPELVLEEIISSGKLPGYFSGIASSDGFRGYILSTFSDLSESGLDHEAAEAILSGEEISGFPERVKALLALYSLYRRMILREGMDIHARFARGLELAEKARLGGPLLAFGFYDFNETQIRLLSRLADNNRVVLFVIDGEGRSHRFAAETTRRLEKAGFEKSPGPLSQSETTGPAGPVPNILEAPDEDAEAREIVRLILKAAKEYGTAFEETAVIYPSSGHFAPMKEALEEAGIPFSVFGGNSFESQNVLRAAGLLIDLLEGGYSRRTLVDFLVSAPLAARHGIGPEFDPFLFWVRRSAEAGLMGENGWPYENREMESSLARIEDGLEKDRAAASFSVVGEILGRIEKAAGKMTGISTWSEGALILEELLRRMFEETDEVEEVFRILSGLSRLDSVNIGVGADSFFKILRLMLRRCSVKGGPFYGEGLKLLTLEQARGLSFRFIYLAGLSDDAIPGKIRQDPFLKDFERERLNGILDGKVFLDKKTGRIDEVELIFYLALDSAEESVACSYPLFESSSGKRLIRSYLVDLLENEANGGKVAASAGGAEENRRDSRGAAGLIRISRDKTPDEFISIEEFDFFRAVSARETGAGALPPSAFFHRASEMLRNRYERNVFTPWDGVFKSDESVAALRSVLKRRDYTFSATSLENYAKCPFSFLSRYILQLKPFEEPERILQITPLTRGSLVHGILEKAYRRFKDERLLPLSEKGRVKVIDLLEKEAEKALDEYQERENEGVRFLWEMERRYIISAVKAYVESELVEAGELEPAMFERSFGFGDEGPSFDIDEGERKIRFHGRIDRIDTGPRGSFRVIDYKTGKIRFKDNEFKGGEYLQLPVYLLGASKILDRDLASGLAEYRNVSPSPGIDRGLFEGDELKRKMEIFEDILRTLVDGIEKGIFFANPFNEICDYCDFSVICPSYGEDLFFAKSTGDGRVRDYLAMKEREE